MQQHKPSPLSERFSQSNGYINVGFTFVFPGDEWLSGSTAGSTAFLNTKPASQTALHMYTVQQVVGQSKSSRCCTVTLLLQPKHGIGTSNS